MPWIDETWLQDALAALKATCDVDAHTRNAMIQFLLDNGFWDQEKLKDWTSAVAKFNSCLNPNKAEFFKIGELWALMRRFGRHQLFLAMAADLGYEVRSIPTEHRRQELMQQLLDVQAQCAAAVERAAGQLERLNTPAPEPRPGAIHGQGRAQFSTSPSDWSAPIRGNAVQSVGCP
ncbi:hypothetical protein [Stenotrophomonas maltophilia]|jgi:hypothetical protein|uniref:Uncharacterized protein n=1 Tax=Stenotrophomonas maltophilia TaxID=40324 RepID=A0A2J0U9B8_STEMA|nr:hypothetical protein [Stenotrophomonas maltophilia]PJL25922.1 hypothetical protein B9Y64_15470 [Stenotrophomonas maltophilia]HEL5401720.1 hypothetical protein [Stenotrophomonas maltophilia]